jgi:ABC-type lipoprotein release transport system permease subunit
MITLRIAFRNIFRQKRRTILTSLTMIVGFALAAVSIGWSDGTYSHIINMFTRNRIGHIQIHHKSYLDEPSLYKTIDDYDSIVHIMESVEAIEAWSPRVNLAGLSSVEEESSGVQIIGIDPEKETIATRFDKKISSGRSLSKEPSREAVIGKGLGEILKADIGDNIVIISQGADGSIANDLYSIVGFVESGDNLSDRMSCYLHIKDAQELLVLGERIHEIIVIVSDLDKVESAMNALNTELKDSHLEVTPWQEVASSFYEAMQADKQGMWIMLFVVVLIVAVEVLNTVLMSVLERTREYGLLKAIGTRPNQVFRLVIYESFIIAAISVIVGVGVGTLGNYLLSVYGISLSEPFTYGGVEFRDMYSKITAQSLYIPAITVILAAVIISIFPAIRAARTASAKSMRMH